MRDKIYLARMRGRPREWYAVRGEPWACRNATLDASPWYHSFHRPRVVARYISSRIRIGVRVAASPGFVPTVAWTKTAAPSAPQSVSFIGNRSYRV